MDFQLPDNVVKFGAKLCCCCMHIYLCFVTMPSGVFHIQHAMAEYTKLSQWQVYPAVQYMPTVWAGIGSFLGLRFDFHIHTSTNSSQAGEGPGCIVSKWIIMSSISPSASQYLIEILFLLTIQHVLWTSVDYGRWFSFCTLLRMSGLHFCLSGMSLFIILWRREKKWGRGVV